MMIQIKFFLYVILIFFFSFCSERSSVHEQEEEELGSYEIISFDPQPLVDPSEISYNLENIEFIRLSNDSNDGLVDEISNIIINDSLIYVIDNFRSNSVSIFDKKGAFIRKLNKIGNAPDEYISINDVRIDKGTGNIELLANSSQKLIKYDINGEFIEYKNLSCPGLFSFYQLGNYYYFYKTLQTCEEERQEGKGFRLTRAKIETPNKIEHSYLPFYFNNRKEPTAMQNNASIRELPNNSDTLLLFEQLTNNILSISEEGIRARYSLEFEGEENSKLMILNDPSIIDKSEAIRKGKLTYLLDWLESDQYIMMQYSYFSTVHKQRFVSKALYNKSTKQISPFQEYSKFMVKLDDIFFDIGKYSMFITSSGKFVCVVYPLDLLQKLTIEKQDKTARDTFNKMIKKYKLENVAENDNPILMMFDFSKS